ncbi:hypothetical protein D3C78_1607820 [compost metagenome]
MASLEDGPSEETSTAAWATPVKVRLPSSKVAVASRVNERFEKLRITGVPCEVLVWHMAMTGYFDRCSQASLVSHAHVFFVG